jgi:hypothetical protein
VATVGSAKVRLEVDRSRFDREWSRAQRDMGRAGKNLGTALKTGALALGAVGAGAAVAGKRLADMAGDAAEVDSKLKVVFGRTLPGVTRELDLFAKSTGASRYELRQQAADLGALLRPLVGGREETGKMSVAVAKLATDLSSFNNVPTEETLLAIRSGLIGEAEPLRRFGVLLNAAKVEAEALRITGKKNADQLTDSEKVQARFNLIMRQTSLAQGDATRTAGSYANMNRRVRNRLSDLATDIGRVLLPAFDGLLGFVDDKVIPRLEDFSGFLDDLFSTERTFKGRVKFAVSGLENLGQELIDAIFEPRGGYRYAIPMDGDRFRIVMRGQTSLADDVSQTFSDAIEAIDWGKLGDRAGKALWKAFAKSFREGLDAMGDFGPEDGGSPRLFRFEGVRDTGETPGFTRMRTMWMSFFDLFKTESAEAAVFGSQQGALFRENWSRAMVRVEATSRRALSDVRAELRQGGRSALAAAGMVEDLRGEINRVRGKNVDVTANVHIKFRIPSGFGRVEDIRLGRPNDGLGVLDRRIHDLARGGIPRTGTAYVTGMPRADVHPHLWDELGMAAMFGLRVSSTHRPGAVTSSGNKSYHSYFPSRAIDLASGSTAGYGDPAMRAMFDWASGRSGLNEVILDPYIWTPGGGRRSIAGTELGRAHRDHVHIGGMGDGLGVEGPADVFELTGPAFRRFMGDGPGRPRPWRPAEFGLIRKKKEKDAAWRRRLREANVSELPVRIQRAMAEAALTKRKGDDINAAVKAVGWWRRGRRTKWLSPRQELDVARNLRSALDDLAAIREEDAPETEAGTTFEAQAAAFLSAYQGIRSSYASNIDYAGGGGRIARPYAPAAPATPPASDRGATRNVTVHFHYTKPPEDPHPALTSARFAAEAAFD